MNTVKTKKKKKVSKEAVVLSDYRMACVSREASLIGRKEVFMGKAKFGIFGDGKEVAQIAMSKVFRKGDFRSGYYRDQTFMFAIGELSVQQYFAQLYAHTDVDHEPASAGRLMNGHFATRMLNEKGELKKLSSLKNSSSDVSPTASQMPRLVGLAYASKLFRQLPELKKLTELSNNGNEIAFGTIGNASTSEGMFFEAINAAGVLQIPMMISVWDDDYGISVPSKFQTTKENISEILKGYQRTDSHNGFEMFTVRGWDYQGLIDTYQKAERICREQHVPVLVHVREMTQPQGHSTSGSHERYKSKQRLEWEAEHDCIRKLRQDILQRKIASEKDLRKIEEEAKAVAKKARDDAWKSFTEDIQKDNSALISILGGSSASEIQPMAEELKSTINPLRLDGVKAAKRALRALRNNEDPIREEIISWLRKNAEENYDRYNSLMYSTSSLSALNIERNDPQYSGKSSMVDGREVLQACFDHALKNDAKVFAIGEDLGKIGDVNQGFAGLQEKHGKLRVADTGIRECTIIGQGIGAALRGLRPIAEIQYLDYLLYAIQILSDDLATLQYRTKGGQKAPLIIRTRGHRLEGVWHAGSPMGMIINSLRGIYVLVPRNMTQAAGFYNTMLRSDDPALIIECLNGYRLKEKLPDNVGEFTIPIGVPEILKEGDDVTIVTYGSMCRIVLEAADELEKEGISCEVIDAQTLLPFDRHQSIVDSLKKTNRIVFADEDVPGGATAFMLQQVIELQGGFQYLDAPPLTISAMENRPAYGSDGDYFSKPSVETIFDKIYEMMHEGDPNRYPPIY